MELRKIGEQILTMGPIQLLVLLLAPILGHVIIFRSDEVVSVVISATAFDNDNWLASSPVVLYLLVVCLGSLVFAVTSASSRLRGEARWPRAVGAPWSSAI